MNRVLKCLIRCIKILLVFRGDVLHNRTSSYARFQFKSSFFHRKHILLTWRLIKAGLVDALISSWTLTMIPTRLSQFSPSLNNIKFLVGNGTLGRWYKWLQIKRTQLAWAYLKVRLLHLSSIFLYFVFRQNIDWVVFMSVKRFIRWFS